MGNGKPAGAEEYVCVFDHGVKLEGTIELPGKFRLEGEVKGAVRGKEHVIVGKGARVEGEIQSAVVSVAGKINGNVTGKKRVEILSSGAVEGDVYTTCLVIEAGGILDGRCHMLSENKAANALPLVGSATQASGSTH